MTIQDIINKRGNTRAAVDEIAESRGIPILAAGDLMTPCFMKCQPIYSTRTGEITGQALSNIRVRRAHQFCVTNATLAMFATPYECYMYLMAGYRAKLLPRAGGGEGRPLSPRALELYERNKKLGQRHWAWIQAQGWDVRQSTGYDSVWGYGYYTPTGFVLVNSNDEIEFTVVATQ